MMALGRLGTHILVALRMHEVPWRKRGALAPDDRFPFNLDVLLRRM